MDIFKDGILINITVNYWSGAKILSPEDLGLKKENVSDAFKLGNKALVPREIIRKFRALEARARNIVDTNSFKFPIGNARFIPKKKFPKILKKLEKIKFEYIQLTEQLVINYDKYRKEMQPIYRDAAEKAFYTSLPNSIEFNIEKMEQEKEHFVNNFLMRVATFYPSANTLRDRFSLGWDVYEIALPRMKKSDSTEIVNGQIKEDIAEEEYRAQTHEKIGKFLDEVVSVLRQETVEICTHIVKNIHSGKVITGATIKSLKNFVENFKELNFVGDIKIEEELNNLQRNFLDNYSSEQITKQIDLQSELKRRLGKLAKIAKETTDINSVTGQYKRKISWKGNGNDTEK